MAHGLRLLKFRCTGCGHCCEELRVPVTSFDVARLCEFTQQAPEQIVEWLAPDQVNMVGEPNAFVELSEGRRLMALAQQGAACSFLHNKQCTVYAARPLSCQLYPFDAQFGKRGGVRRLKLLGGVNCDFARDGLNHQRELFELDRRHAAELRAYWDKVNTFNRRVRKLRHLHKALPSAQDFFQFVGLGAS